MHKRRFVLLAGMALACILAHLFIGLRGNVAFALEFRLTRLAALLEVAISIAVSTVLFQTATGNRILTPSTMGLDALYVLSQLLLILLIGGIGFAALDARLKLGGEVILLSCALLFPILKMRIVMGLMLLTGVVVGVLFRSLPTLIARLIDPNEFAVAQHTSFANFNDVETGVLTTSTGLTIIGIFIAWRMRHILDVLLLGRENAIGLGVDWVKSVTGLLLLVAALVFVSTALVGPVAFLGLLVVALAEKIVASRQHGLLLPVAMLVSIILLVGGQTLLQHTLSNASSLGIVIEFFGGLAFLLMLVAGSRK